MPEGFGLEGFFGVWPFGVISRRVGSWGSSPYCAMLIMCPF